MPVYEHVQAEENEEILGFLSYKEIFCFCLLKCKLYLLTDVLKNETYTDAPLYCSTQTEF